MGELAPGHDSHAIVVEIICSSNGRDLGSAEPREVMLSSPSVALFVSRVLAEMTLYPRAEWTEGLPSFLYSVEYVCASRLGRRIECVHPPRLFLSS
jgi:hypothetical protein